MKEFHNFKKVHTMFNNQRFFQIFLDIIWPNNIIILIFDSEKV